MKWTGNEKYEIYNLVKENVRIEDVISSYGISLIQTSPTSFKALCPFHNDTKESLSIQTREQYYKCFSCGEGGTAIEFIIGMEKKDNPQFSFEDAILKLKNDFSLPIDMNTYERKIHNERYTISGKKYSRNVIRSIEMNSLLNSVFRNYLFTTNQGSKYLDYLKLRGLTVSSIKEFGIGFCPENALRTFYDNIDNVKYKSAMIDTGLIEIDNPGTKEYKKEFFKDRITFPIKDVKGNIVGYTARTLDPRSNIKYKNSSDSSLFQKSSILYNFDKAKSEALKSNKIIILEGNVDVVSAYEMGVKNAIGLDGCSMSSQQIDMILDLGVDIAVSLDNDNAGHSGTLKVMDDIKERMDAQNISGISLSCLDLDDFGNFKDFGDILQESISNPGIRADFSKKILSVEKSDFEFSLKYDYFSDRDVTSHSIKEVYSMLENQMDSEKMVIFKDFCHRKSGYSFDTIQDIIDARQIESNPFAQLGMTLINPFLDRNNLTDSQKQIAVSKILGDLDNCLEIKDDSITMNKGRIDRIVEDVLSESRRKDKTLAIRTETKIIDDGLNLLTLEGICKAHHSMFPDVENSGKLRKGNVPGACCSPNLIPSNFQNTVRYINSVPADAPRKEKIKSLSNAFGNILKIRMFDGPCGRIERIFLDRSAQKLGLNLDYSRIDKKDYQKAVASLMSRNDLLPIEKMIDSIAEPIANKDRRNQARSKAAPKHSSLDDYTL